MRCTFHRMRNVMMKHALVTVFMMGMLGAVGIGGPAACAMEGPPQAQGPPAQQPQQPQQQEEFLPIDELPPQDQLPAAPLLVTAYVFVVLALFAYVVSVARRLGAVQRDLDRLQSDLKRSGRT
jgi:hypothetical protein